MGARCSKTSFVIPDIAQKISDLLLVDGTNTKSAIVNTTQYNNSDNGDNDDSNEPSMLLKVKENINDKELFAETRQSMKEYWDEHAKSQKTNSLMLLMQDNPDFEVVERYEILSYLPDVNNLDIVELGAGIGRFTGELASTANTILAIDFIEDFLRENAKRHNRIYDNITFLHKDVTLLVLEKESKDFIFSNWLMMYLNDEETKKLIYKMYLWCKSGGYIFFRESCEGGASGDKIRTNNPTYYRKQDFYTNCFAQFKDLTLIHCKNVQCYVDHKNKTNQYCWLYYKD